MIHTGEAGRSESTAGGGFQAGAGPGAVAPLTPATGYSFNGPAGGLQLVASSAFTVALTPTGGTSGGVTITPSDGGAGGAFTPATVALSTGTPSATFTYTPPAGAATRTLSVANSGALANPANLSYAVTVAPATLSIPKLAAFFASDMITLPGYQVYRIAAGAFVAVGGHVTAGITLTPGVVNGYAALVGVPADAGGGFSGVIVWDNAGAIMGWDELAIPPVSTLAKIAPFFSADPMTAPGYQLYQIAAGALVAVGGHVTTGIALMAGITNGYAANVAVPEGGGLIVWDNGASLVVQDELSTPVAGEAATAAVASSALVEGRYVVAVRSNRFIVH